MTENERVERLRRSIQAFERLHAVIVGFALTTSVRTFADPWFGGTDSAFPHIPPGFFLFVAFLATLIPFFHGATRHLETTHLTPGSATRRGVLMFDYIMLFLEGAVFALLGMAVLSPPHFVGILEGLILLDSLWAVVTWSVSGSGTHLFPWLILNFVTLLALFVLDSWIDGSAWVKALAIASVLRSIVDYYLNWDFYFGTREAAEPIV
jgi:hypothetical protein